MPSYKTIYQTLKVMFQPGNQVHTVLVSDVHQIVFQTLYCLDTILDTFDNGISSLWFWIQFPMVC